MSLNEADSCRIQLKAAVKEGKTACGAIAANIDKIISGALWEYLSLPGETAADKLHNLIVLPYGAGGINCEINHIDALLGMSPSVQTRFRTLVFKAKQGERNDLKPVPKVEVDITPVKTKTLSDSQKAKERACGRALEAIPELEPLLDNDVVGKETIAKLGKKVKDPENPTENEVKAIEQRKEVAKKLKEIVPEPLPTEPKKVKELKQKVKQAVEETTGKKSAPKVSLGADVQKVAKAIVKANSDLEYLKDLVYSLECEIDELTK